MIIANKKVSFHTKNYAVTGYTEPFDIWIKDGTVYNKIGEVYKSSLREVEDMIIELELKNAYKRKLGVDLGGEVLRPVEGSVN